MIDSTSVRVHQQAAFRDHEMLEFRIGRLVTRWRPGERLAKVARGHGPGRPGKSANRLADSFRSLIDRLKITDPVAIDAQRIACLPPAELEAFWAFASRKSLATKPHPHVRPPPAVLRQKRDGRSGA
jgi:hypothetical protein